MTIRINPYEAGTERDHDNPHIERVHDKHTMSYNSSYVYKGKQDVVKLPCRHVVLPKENSMWMEP